jgi:hypothetical protein
LFPECGIAVKPWAVWDERAEQSHPDAGTGRIREIKSGLIAN